MGSTSFIGGLLLAATMGQARAEVAKTYRIAILDPITPVDVMNESAGPYYPLWRPLFTELRRLGYVEGQNLTVERYGIKEYSPDLARKVVAGSPDVIFADGGNAVVHDLLPATSTIPIVAFMFPLPSAFITNIAHPGSNLTGIDINPGDEVAGKRLELLREMLPNMSKVGYLATRESWKHDLSTDVERATKKLGVTVVDLFLETPVSEPVVRRFFADIAKERVDALVVTGSVFPFTPLVIQLAQEYRLPAMYGYSYFAQIGGLIAYDFGLKYMGRILADQIDQILKGTKPGDIPIYQAEKFDLTINMKTAKALGLTVPPALLASADEVIE
jgi:putative tryptophan/tyrosine transport system substrate-binding protein